MNGEGTGLNSNLLCVSLPQPSKLGDDMVDLRGGEIGRWMTAKS